MDETHLHDLLNNNDRPQEQVTQHVRQRLHEAETELNDLEDQIQQLRKRADAKGLAITQYKAILGPIRSVSDDVLREIFTQIMDTDTDDSFPCFKHRNAPPVLLTHVCQRWRAVALSTPRLWCKLTITLPPILSGGSTGTMTTVGVNATARQCEILTEEADRMQKWLQRAGAIPLSLSILQGSLSFAGLWPNRVDLDPLITTQLSWMFEIVSSYLPRCERLALTLPDEPVYQLFSAHVTADKIQGISYFKPNIFRLYHPEGQQAVLGTPLFTHLPSLRRLHLTHPMTFILFRENESSWPYPPDTWKALTHLTVDGSVSLSQAATVMESCTSLVQLRLYVAQQSWLPNNAQLLPPPVQKEIHMPMLQYLRLTFNPTSFIRSQALHTTRDLYTLSTPRLQRLQFCVSQALVDRHSEGNDAVDFTRCVPLEHILRSASNTLTDLILSPRKIKEESFIPLLQGCPHLTRLYIRSNCHFPPSIFQQYIDNGYQLVSDTDAAFHHLFALPEWCKLPAFAASVPLAEVEGVDMEMLGHSLEDALCPGLEHLDLRVLLSVRNDTLLWFIVWRLRLYEYARLLPGWSKTSPSSFKAFRSLSVAILGKREDDIEIWETVQKLASVVGVEDVQVKVEYQEQRNAPFIVGPPMSP